MKRGSTLFLRGVVLVIGLVVLALCIFGLPVGIQSENVGGYRWILLGMYLPAVPFVVALYQAMKLLDYVDRNKVFSAQSVQALGVIKLCAVVISALYAAGLPYIFVVADRDDAPGVVLLGLIFTFAPLVIAVFSGILQKLLQNAIDLKSENELTV